MPRDQIPQPPSWKAEADLTDQYRISIARVAQLSMADLGKAPEEHHHLDNLVWMLKLFLDAYDDIDASHIRRRETENPSDANHLKHLLGSLMVGAFQIGALAVADNPNIETAKIILSSRQARGARKAWQGNSASLADERRRAIIEMAGGLDKLRKGRKYAADILSQLAKNPNFKHLTSGIGFSETSVWRQIKSILEE